MITLEMDHQIAWWADAVWGTVLEIGLGQGHLARAIEANPKVTTHIIIDNDESLKGTEPEGVEVLWMTWPCSVGVLFDCITIDLPGFSWAMHKAALVHLREGGAVFVRIPYGC